MDYWKIGIPAVGWIITVVLWVLNEWRSRTQPQHVICRPTEKESWLAIHRWARNKIKVSYDEKFVDSLAYVEVEIFNSGTLPISEPVIDVVFNNQTLILGGHCVVRPNQGEQYKLNIDKSLHVLKLSVPYLNPYKLHKQCLKLQMICDGDVDSMRFFGGAEGWSVKAFSPPSAQEMGRSRRRNGWAVVICILIYLVTVLFKGYYAELSRTPWAQAIIGVLLGLLLVAITVLTFLNSRNFEKYAVLNYKQKQFKTLHKYKNIKH